MTDSEILDYWIAHSTASIREDRSGREGSRFAVYDPQAVGDWCDSPRLALKAWIRRMRNR